MPLCGGWPDTYELGGVVDGSASGEIDQVARSGVKSTWAAMSGPFKTAAATAGCAKSATQVRKESGDGERDRESRQERRQRLGQEELLVDGSVS